MKQFLLAFLILGIGLTSGYIIYPLVNSTELINSSQQNPITSTQTVNCELDEIQIKGLAAKIAPSIGEYLIASGSVASNPELVAQQQKAAEKIQNEKETAFSQAEELVDQMILNRNVTTAELNQAIQLLAETGQEDKTYLLQARIAVAVNKGELTPQQAGYIWGNAE